MHGQNVVQPARGTLNKTFVDGHQTAAKDLGKGAELGVVGARPPHLLGHAPRMEVEVRRLSRVNREEMERGEGLLGKGRGDAAPPKVFVENRRRFRPQKLRCRQRLMQVVSHLEEVKALHACAPDEGANHDG